MSLGELSFIFFTCGKLSDAVDRRRLNRCAFEGYAERPADS